MSTKERIVEAAADQFFEEGYHATGMKQVALVAGVGKATIYEYFDSKGDLLLAATRHLFDKEKEELLANMKEQKSAEEKLRYLFERSVDPETSRYWLHKHMKGQKSMEKEVFSVIKEAYADRVKLVHSLLEEGRDQGEFSFKTEEIPSVCKLFMGLIKETVLLACLDQGDRQEENINFFLHLLKTR